MDIYEGITAKSDSQQEFVSDSVHSLQPNACIACDATEHLCKNGLFSREIPELANLEQIERTYGNACPAIDPESIEHFCRTWAEVGQAILARRNK
jgi:hypothetical protein